MLEEVEGAMVVLLVLVSALVVVDDTAVVVKLRWPERISRTLKHPARVDAEMSTI